MRVYTRADSGSRKLFNMYVAMRVCPRSDRVWLIVSHSTVRILYCHAVAATRPVGLRRATPKCGPVNRAELRMTSPRCGSRSCAEHYYALFPSPSTELSPSTGSGTCIGFGIANAPPAGRKDPAPFTACTPMTNYNADELPLFTHWANL